MGGVTMTTRRIDGITFGYPDGMTESQWTNYVAGRGRHPEPYNWRPRYIASPVYAAAVKVREEIHGRDPEGWPQRDRFRELHVQLLEGVFGFATLVEAARRCASEADAQIIEAAFQPREEF
jgi:hypothetical protein